MKIMIDPAIMDHPKVLRLARELHLGRVRAVGHLIAIWGWAATYRVGGCLAGMTSVEISEAARYSGQAVRFVEAMRRVGFLDGEDGNLQVHDWQDFQGDIDARRAKDRERKRAQRVQMESVRNPGGVRKESTSPFPSHPFPIPSLPSASAETDGGLRIAQTDGTDGRTTDDGGPCPKGCLDGFLQASKSCCTCETGRARAKRMAKGMDRERGAAALKAAELPRRGAGEPSVAERLKTMSEAEARRLVAELVAADPSLETLTASRSPREVLKLCASKLNGHLGGPKS